MSHGNGKTCSSAESFHVMHSDVITSVLSRALKYQSFSMLSPAASVIGPPGRERTPAIIVNIDGVPGHLPYVHPLSLILSPFTNL